MTIMNSVSNAWCFLRKARNGADIHKTCSLTSFGTEMIDPVILSTPLLPQHPTSKWTEIWELRGANSGTQPSSCIRKIFRKGKFNTRKGKNEWLSGCVQHSKLLCFSSHWIYSKDDHLFKLVGGGNTTGWHFSLEPVNIGRSFLVGAPTGNLFSSSAVAPTSPNCKTCCTKCKPADRRKRTYYMKDEIIMQVNYSPLNNIQRYISRN